MNVKGIQLRIGDTVLKQDDDTGRRRPDATLSAYIGQCSNGMHFRTTAGQQVCYDKCADLVIV